MRLTFIIINILTEEDEPGYLASRKLPEPETVIRIRDLLLRDTFFLI